ELLDQLSVRWVDLVDLRVTVEVGDAPEIALPVGQAVNLEGSRLERVIELLDQLSVRWVDLVDLRVIVEVGNPNKNILRSRPKRKKKGHYYETNALGVVAMLHVFFSPSVPNK
ncbi:MAG TPA: hypothetical protein PLV44_11685, partial [Myxococcota bacterium]|nr:hypothetical protein [Myxococcota bacterium]